MPFAMGAYVVTFEDYERCCDDTKLGKPEDLRWGRARRPVINVSWEDARATVPGLASSPGATTGCPARRSGNTPAGPEGVRRERAHRLGLRSVFTLGGAVVGPRLADCACREVWLMA